MWNLDPHCRNEIKTHVLLIEPSHIQKYPISSKRLNWIETMAQNIHPHIIIIYENFETLRKKTDANLYLKPYPCVNHWSGTKDSQGWMFDLNSKYFNRFFFILETPQKKIFLSLNAFLESLPHNKKNNNSTCG